MLTNLQNFSLLLERVFAAKGMKYFPPHLTFVAALPWEVKSPNFVKSYKRVEPKNVYQVQ